MNLSPRFDPTHFDRTPYVEFPTNRNPSSRRSTLSRHPDRIQMIPDAIFGAFDEYPQFLGIARDMEKDRLVRGR